MSSSSETPSRRAPSSATTVSTSVPSRPTRQRRPCSRPTPIDHREGTPFPPIHRYRAFLLNSPGLAELLKHDRLIMGGSSVAAPKKYPDGLRARAVRLYRESDPKPVIRKLAEQLGVHPGDSPVVGVPRLRWVEEHLKA